MTATDISAVVELIKHNWDEVLIHHHRKDTYDLFCSEVTFESFEKQLTWKEMYVLEDDSNEILATGSLANFGTPETLKLSVSMLFVLPELHSRRIGGMLLKHLFDSAQKQGVKLLHVPSSKNAVRFYAHFGFVIDDFQPDEAVEITWMTKEMGTT
jgi:N-acetylglutamate synthase-like GNAT family acetyltransferase